MNFKLGSIVTIPSGEKFQIKEIRYHWVKKYGVKQDRIKSVCDLILSQGFGGRQITIRDYQCTFFGEMAECC